MWEHRCSATNANGRQCARQSRIAQWCHAFESWRNDGTTGPSWWETCTQHAGRASRVVASLPVRPLVVR